MRLPGSRVTLNTDVQDQHGLPVPNVHSDDHANDVAMRSYAYDVADQLYGAVGALAVHHTPPYPSTHNLGTCRMSADPADGVVPWRNCTSTRSPLGWSLMGPWQ